MTNMGYCRFENTARDLSDCIDHLNDTDLSESEKDARDNLIELCFLVTEIIPNED